MDKQVLLDLGRRLRRARKHFKLTQAQLAERLGVSKSSIINYESGKRIPDAVFLIGFLDTFGIDARWLMLGGGGMNASGTERETFALDTELAELFRDCRIPLVRLGIMAEYAKLKEIYKDLLANQREKLDAETFNAEREAM